MAMERVRGKELVEVMKEEVLDVSGQKNAAEERLVGDWINPHIKPTQITYLLLFHLLNEPTLRW